MNILQISTYDNKGGTAKVAWMLKQELEKRNHKTSMFVAHKLSTASNVYQIPNRFTNRLFSVALASDLDFFQSDAILQTEQYRQADIIHCHNLHGYYFNLTTLQKMAKEKPVIWTLHDMWAITSHCAHAFNGPLKNGFYQCPSRNIYPPLLWPNEKYLESRKRKTYGRTSFKVVVPSRWLEEKVKTSVLKKQPLSLIYNGVDTAIFYKKDKNQSRKKLHLPLNKKIILFIGDGWKNVAWKGYEYLEEVREYSKNNKQILFLLIGKEKLRREDAGFNLETRSFINDQSLLTEYYSAADLFLLSSIAENFPLAMLEAMACGVPVVSFDVGGVKEAVIHKKNGYIAKYQDCHDLINGIDYIFGLSKEELSNLSLNSRERVKKYFSQDEMVIKYINLYKSLLTK